MASDESAVGLETGGRTMGKKIVVVNAGPRKGWNTDILLSEASEGAVSAGAEIQRFDLFKLERYTDAGRKIGMVCNNGSCRNI